MDRNGKRALKNKPQQSNKRPKRTQQGNPPSNGVARPPTEARGEFVSRRPPNPYRTHAPKIATKPPPQKPSAASAHAASAQSSTKGQKHDGQEVIVIDLSDDEVNKNALEKAGFMQNVDDAVEKGPPVYQITLDSFLAKQISSPSEQKMAFQALTTSRLTSQGGAIQDGNHDGASSFASRQMSPNATLDAAEDSTAADPFPPNTNEGNANFNDELEDSKPAAIEYATPTKPATNNTNTAASTNDVSKLNNLGNDNDDELEDSKPAAIEYATPTKPAANNTNTAASTNGVKNLNDVNDIQQVTNEIQRLSTGSNDNDTNRDDSATTTAEKSALAPDSSEKKGHVNKETMTEDPSDTIDARQGDSNEQESVASGDSSSKADVVVTPPPSVFSRVCEGLASMVWMAVLTVLLLILICLGLTIIAIMFAGLVGMCRTLHDEDDE